MVSRGEPGPFTKPGHYSPGSPKAQPTGDLVERELFREKNKKEQIEGKSSVFSPHRTGIISSVVKYLVSGLERFVCGY
jgi:hypothetical protein